MHVPMMVGALFCIILHHFTYQQQAGGTFVTFFVSHKTEYVTLINYVELSLRAQSEENIPNTITPPSA